ncbi:hypothetical protein CKO28_10360 [Rhodovibrio sodomensis]|uniref:Uncharacterized protein n=1 Tax=Rhodovibrio sodomensis TaxID=1088 RepID=A0ABS1DES8_9PROT|nr:hypothetical protein [Rhodovibrio sodomensis]MBK1668437.1 hypothetical protein [Rhodovibrio sodomensis]
MMKPWDVLAILMYGLVAALAALAAESTNILDVVFWGSFGVGASLFLAGLFKRIFLARARALPEDIADVAEVEVSRLNASMTMGFLLAAISGGILYVV